MSDEALALKLQAEYDAQQRPARERSRLGAKPPARATRAAGRPNGRVKYNESDVSCSSPNPHLCHYHTVNAVKTQLTDQCRLSFLCAPSPFFYPGITMCHISHLMQVLYSPGSLSISKDLHEAGQ